MRRIREALDELIEKRGAIVMGVVNATPDSFYEDSRSWGEAAARLRIDRVVAEGADVVDIGGESTRPGAPPVPADEQLRRVLPAVRHALGTPCLVSVDTTSPEVAGAALELGAHLINDVSCLADPRLAEAIARHGAALVLMHCRGRMTDMEGFSRWPDDAYRDVVEDVLLEWRAARDRAVAAGVRREDVLLDPGIGFAKNARQSLELLGRLDELTREGAPVVVGASRKSFIDAVDPSTPGDRLGGSLAAALLAARKGAGVLRVHDVRATRQALDVTRAMAPRPREVARA